MKGVSLLKSYAGCNFSQHHGKEDDKAKFKQFLSTFTSLAINTPLVQALNKMPTYAQLMKRSVTKKEASDCEAIENPHNYGALFTRQVVEKRKDPHAFIVPCIIEACNFRRALCDLGASVNLMPLMVFDQLGVNIWAPTTMKLIMADRIK